MSGVLVRCPAKINLALRIVGLRPDGYHELATVFQAIDRWDELEAVPSKDLSLDCDDPAVPTDERNLVVRAAQALREIRPQARRRGARLTLRKTIPAGGGLGGGSSDAAGAILALDALWGLGLTDEERHVTAASLGSDVNFFLVGGTALGTDRGETVRRLPPRPERDLVLGTPPFALATREVFARLELPLTPADAGVTVRRLLGKLTEGNDFGLAVNDLEAAAFTMRPELRAFRDAVLRSGGGPALLCGSGSSVFGIFAGASAAREAASRLGATFPEWSVVSTRTVDAAATVGRRGAA